MLGFETPQKGAVYYDGKDLSSIDLKSLRRRIGTVIQDGKLFQGDIFSNITISAPWLTLDDAWEAAELAGIADDIRKMPMGMQTIISEGDGGVSGGQRQRILIARARIGSGSLSINALLTAGAVVESLSPIVTNFAIVSLLSFYI